MCCQLRTKIYHSALFSDPLLLVHLLLGSWKYTYGLIMDGNFKAEHLHDWKAEDQVWLMDGLGFMVSWVEQDLSFCNKYSARGDPPTVSDSNSTHVTYYFMKWSSCNNHHAVNQANASHRNLEASSIGGTACVWHGYFVPHSTVDFQKGERWVNCITCVISELTLPQAN